MVNFSGSTTNFLLWIIAFFLLNVANPCSSQAADCVTISDVSWSCGTPGPSDDLYVYHQVTISGGFNVMSSLTIYDGGKLTITGNLQSQSGSIIIKEGGELIVEGGSIFTNNSNITIEGGKLFIDGNMNISGGTDLYMLSGSVLDVTDNMSINSDSVYIDGTINVGNNFNNNSDLTGYGLINYNGSCLGSGSVNQSYSYCGGGAIDMIQFTCVPTDYTLPVIADMPADQTVYIPTDACDVAVSWIPPTATDDCAMESFSATHQPNNIFPIGTTVVTYTAKDRAGNIAIDSFKVTVIDNIQPSLYNIPGSFRVNADPGQCGAIVTWTEPSVTENCSYTLTSDHSPGDFFPVGITNITYIVTDLSGNQSHGSFAVEVISSGGSASINCPSDTTIYLGARACEAQVFWDEPSNASCWSNVVQSHNSGDTFNVGDHQVVYEYTDGTGTISTCSFNVSILDTISPEILNLPSDITVNADPGSCGATVNWIAPVASDKCSVSLSSSHSPDDYFPISETTVTYTATDASGNTVSKSFIVKVLDNESPEIINLPSDITVNADPGSCGATVNWIAPVASDNCSVSLSSSHSPKNYFPISETTVTYTATDASGNTVSKSFIVKVLDNEFPIINNIPSNIIITAEPESCGASVTWIEPGVSDNCSASLSSDFSSGDFFSLGTTTVIYLAIDASGNSAKKSFQIEVIQSGTLSTSDCPPDLTYYLKEGQCEVEAYWTEPTVSGCDITTKQSHYPGDFFVKGVHEVKYEFTNPAGISATCIFNITVKDTIAPRFVGFPENIEISADNNSCSGSPSWTSPSAIDNCGIVDIACSVNANDALPLGETVVEYIAKDGSGNETKKSFTVTVIDKSPPEFLSCPNEFKVLSFNEMTKEAAVSWEIPVVRDACSSVTLTSNYNPGQTFDVGTSTIVTYTAVDSYDNEATCSFEVFVNSNLHPEAGDVFLTIGQGESTEVIINASDPNSDEIFIRSIDHDESRSFISNVDEKNLSFTYTPYEDFKGTDTIEVVLEDSGAPVLSTTVKVIIKVEGDDQVKTSSVITVNGDNMNDVWLIENIELYPDNKVQIYDRWGSILYSVHGYNNKTIVWGGSTIDGEFASTGTYFYVIVLGNGEKALSGAIEVIR